MGVERVQAHLRESAPSVETVDMFPALQHRQQRPFDHRVDLARRALWRAYQRGALSEEELASTLDRLEDPLTASPQEEFGDTAT